MIIDYINNYPRCSGVDVINTTSVQPSFQMRTESWLHDCFGINATNKAIRNHRFLEEALELVQACECTEEDAHRVVDYVFNRDVGEKHQEVGGVMVTLAGLCLAQNLDMHACAEIELARVQTKTEAIRAKDLLKPKFTE